ncbi:hypothetical protein P7C70_g8713, partial [Phenoliferia sp. Uapishka_3]
MFEELKVLADLVVDAKIAQGLTPGEARILPLSGVHAVNSDRISRSTVIIIHIKDDILPLPVPIPPPFVPLLEKLESDPNFLTPSSKSSPRRTLSPSTVPPPLPPISSASSTNVSPHSPTRTKFLPPAPASQPPFIRSSTEGSTPNLRPSIQLSSDTSPLSSASSISPGTRLDLLNMSPPVPSPPIRRASGGNMPPSVSGGWGFTRRASMAPPPPSSDPNNRRMSLPHFLGSGVVGIDRLLSSLTPPSNWRRTNGSASSGGLLGPPPSNGLEMTEEVSEGSSSGPSPVMVAHATFLKGMEDGLGALEGEGETEEETVHETIERELNELEEVERTGVRFLRAEQGMRIG